MPVAERIAELPQDGSRLWWLGGGTFVLRAADASIWIDPFFGPPAKPQFTRQYPPLLLPPDVGAVDAVLITHEHNDHCHLPTLTDWASRLPPFPVYAPGPSAAKVEAGLPDADVVVVAAGDTVQVAGAGLTVIEGNDPMSEGPVMYHVETASGSVLFAGDSLYRPDFLREVQPLGIDVAFFAVGDLLFGEKAYNSPEGFGLAARESGARAAIPVHWDLWEEARLDALEVDDWGTEAVLLLRPGEGVEMV